MKQAAHAVDHGELARLIVQLGPDPERERLAAASAEANAYAVALGAELEALTTRVGEVTARIGGGVLDHAERVRVARARAAVETETVFAPGRLEAATVACARAELAYLAYVYRVVYDHGRVSEADHLAAHRAWAGPAVRADLLAQTTRAEYDERRAELAVQLVPLAASRGATARRLAGLQDLHSFLRAFTETRYGPDVNLANPRTFDEPVRVFAGRAVARWRAALAA